MKKILEAPSCSFEAADEVLVGMVTLLLAVKQTIDAANQKAQVCLTARPESSIYDP